jgi:hypothetical protein
VATIGEDSLMYAVLIYQSLYCGCLLVFND